MAEIWDFRNASTILCPLTSGDLPSWCENVPVALGDATIRRVILRVSENDSPRAEAHNPNYSPPGSEEFPQLCSADFDALTTDEITNIEMGGAVSDLLKIDTSFNNILSTTPSCVLDMEDQFQVSESSGNLCADLKQSSSQVNCINLFNDGLIELITPKRSSLSRGTDTRELWAFPSALSPLESKSTTKFSHEAISSQTMKKPISGRCTLDSRQDSRLIVYGAGISGATFHGSPSDPSASSFHNPLSVQSCSIGEIDWIENTSITVSFSSH